MRSSLFCLFIASLIQVSFSVETSGGQPILEPVSDNGWEKTLQRRSVKDSIKLQEKEHFVWSSAAESKDNIFVNMTLFTGDEELVISMERFAHELKAVNCSQDMMMSFTSNSSFQHAIKSWDWVNFNENRTFIMVANYPGCGKAKSRQPWIVSNVNYDPKLLVVHLNATKKAWKDVAHTYNMDFGQYSPAASSRVRRLNFNKQINLDLTSTLPTAFYSSVDVTKDLTVAVTCSNCGTKGTLTLAGHIETSWFSLKTFTVSATPSGIQADLNLSVSLSATDPSLGINPAPWDFFTIPLGGFSIPEVLTLGPALTLGAGFGVTGVSGKATISSSITGTIPDSSVAEIQLAGDKGATFQGWVPEFSATPLEVTEQLSASLSVYGNAKVGVELEVLGNGMELDLNLKVPNVVVTASLVHNSQGVCADKIHTTGVSLGMTVGADLAIQGSTELLGTQDIFLNVPVFHAGVAFGPPPLCFGFGDLVG